MRNNSIEYQLRLSEIRFAPSSRIGHVEARIDGFVSALHDGIIRRFSVAIDYDAQYRQWRVDPRRFRWKSPVDTPLFEPKNIRLICEEIKKAFGILWFRPIVCDDKQEARVEIGQAAMTEGQEQNAFAVVRSDVLAIYRLDWPKLWSAIENRLNHDPEFSVSGFTRRDAIKAIVTLRRIFTWEWVRKRYRDAANQKSDAGMWEEMYADEVFPAYRLARTAIGCICKDPGWNHLITLARSFDALMGFSKGHSVLKRLAQEPGHIHQANFAGHLCERGLLVELDSPTGCGSATHDMTARVCETAVDIEMKTVSSDEPLRRIEKEVADKCRKRPVALQRPVVFFVLVLEKSVVGEQKNSRQQVDSITEQCLINAGWRERRCCRKDVHRLSRRTNQMGFREVHS